MARSAIHSLPRVKYLRNRFGAEVLAAAGRRDEVGESCQGSAIFDRLVEFDPSPKARNLSRVVKWFIDGSIALEDATTVRETLDAFEAVKASLPVEMRDVGQFETIADLRRMLRSTKSSEMEAMPSSLLDSCETIVQGEGWSIARITSMQAATWWAKGTSWCVKDPFLAQDYLELAPLHLLLVGSRRWLVHFPTDQFMDEDDAPFVPGSAPDSAVAALLRIASQPVEGGSFVRAEFVGRCERLLDASLPVTHILSECRTWRHLPSGNHVYQPLMWKTRSVPVFVLDAAGREIAEDDATAIALTEDFARYRLLELSGGGTGSLLDPRGLSWMKLGIGADIETKDCFLIDSGRATALVRQCSGPSQGSSIVLVDLRSGKAMHRTTIYSIDDLSALDGERRGWVHRAFETVGAMPDILAVFGQNIFSEEGLAEWVRRHSSIVGVEQIMKAMRNGHSPQVLPLLERIVPDAETARGYAKDLALIGEATVLEWLRSRADVEEGLGMGPS